MNRRQKIIVSVTGIFLVLLLLVGLTYAYFLTKITGNKNTKSISVSTANLALVYGDGNGVIEPTEKLLPGTTIDSKTFTVKNEGNDTTEYVVVIEDVVVTNVSDSSTTTFESNDFVYTLTCTSDGVECNSLSTEATFPITGGILIGNSVEVGKTHSYTLTVTYKETGIDQSNDMNKTLTAKVNIADPNSYNPYVGDKGSLAYNIINNAVIATTEEKALGYAEYRTTPLTTPAVDGTQLFKNVGEESTSESNVSINTIYQKYYWTYGTGYTVDYITGKFTLTGVNTCQYNDGSCHETLVGKYIVSTSASSNSSSTETQKTATNISNIYKVTSAPASSTSTITMKAKKIINILDRSAESTLTTTVDEYGTSYYYRGDVENNYLTFNNGNNDTCWRIVRIEGDGAIKIVLADWAAGCSEATLAKTDSAYIGTGDYGYTTDANGKYYADYENSAVNISSMKYKFNIFLNGGNFTSYDSNNNEETKTYTAWSDEAKAKLKTTTACIGDTTTKYDDNGAIITTNSILYYYNSYLKLYGISQPANATLLCNATGGKTSETQIFPLTADEVIFAGGMAGVDNYTYYLRENTTTGYWWTLSPAAFQISSVNVFGVDYNGCLSNSFEVSVGVGSLRPAVSLIPGTQFASGDGSISNPYTIK